MTQYYKKIEDCYNYIRSKTDFVPKTALVLGSGLGDFADGIDKISEIEYSAIPSFPTSTVEGHKGKFVFGYVEGKAVAVMQGRVHFYEGYDIHDVVLPVRLLHLLGSKRLILTNAAGGIHPSFKTGALMMIVDHISSFVPSPLRGENVSELGTRFPDMSHVYSPALCGLIRKSAQDVGIDLKEGIYVQTPGPNYETPAEINMYKLLGADAVGMSTACEAMAAVHAGMEVCGISCISNMAAGISKTPLTHAEIKIAAEKVSGDFVKLLNKIIKDI